MQSSPAAPSATETANAQTASNRDSAIAGALINNVDQNTPFGSVKYTQDGYTTYTDSSGQTVQVPKIVSTQTLSPEQQALYGKQSQASSNLGDLAVSQTSLLSDTLGKPIDTSTLPANADMSLLNKDYSADRARVSGDIMSRVNEDYARDDAALETQLMNQGLQPGSQAWNDAKSLAGRQLADARVQADLAGGQEQSRLAGLDAQTYNAQAAARTQALEEALTLRNQPINETSALLSGSQVTAPTFSSPYQQGVGTTDVAGITQQAYANQQQQANAYNSGLFGLGSTALSGLFALSDRRAKKDIEKVGKTDGGTPIYLFRYKGENDSTPRQMGVIAQEVWKTNPEAVRKLPTGLMAVNYDKVA